MQIFTSDSKVTDSGRTEVIRESDFYQQLKSATDNGQQQTFALLLSMLTTDARDFDEFHQPHRRAESYKTDLYNKFFIQNKPVTGEFSAARSVCHNQLIQQQQRQSVHLDLSLNPEPLLAKSNSEIAPEVLENLGLNVRAKLMAQQSPLQQLDDATGELDAAQSKANSSKEIDVESWFNVLEQARTLAMMA